VSIRDIADAADVSTTTLFKHFSGKEAPVFDREDAQDAALISAVRDRADVVEALREQVVAAWLPLASDPRLSAFTELVEATPALRNYSERMWTRHAVALGAAIAGSVGVAADDVRCVALARFVLEIPTLTRGRSDRAAAVDAVFDLLRNGWSV
jgi:AcrR family transcriptional regulator